MAIVLGFVLVGLAVNVSRSRDSFGFLLFEDDPKPKMASAS